MASETRICFKRGLYVLSIGATTPPTAYYAGERTEVGDGRGGDERGREGEASQEEVRIARITRNGL